MQQKSTSRTTRTRKQEIKQTQYLTRFDNLPTSLGQGERVLIEFNQLQVTNIGGHYPSLYSQRIHEEKETKSTKIGSETDSKSDLKIGRATELVDL